MIVTMTFNLPEEEIEHKMALVGGRAVGVLFNFDQVLRGHLKYESIPEHIKTPYEYAEHIRTVLHDYIDEAGLTDAVHNS